MPGANFRGFRCRISRRSLRNLQLEWFFSPLPSLAFKNERLGIPGMFGKVLARSCSRSLEKGCRMVTDYEGVVESVIQEDFSRPHALG